MNYMINIYRVVWDNQIDFDLENAYAFVILKVSGCIFIYVC